MSGCCIEHDGEMLLLLRNKRESNAETWGSPAGKHEAEEDMYDAVLREVFEETGLSLSRDALRHAGTLYVTAGETDILYHQFHTVMDALGPIIIRPDEHSDYRWVKPDAVAGLPLIHDLEDCIALVYNA